MVASRLAGGRWAERRSAISRRGEPGRVPAHQRLERRVGGVADGEHPPARGGRERAALTQRRSASSWVRRSSRASGSQVSSSTTAAYPPSATGSAPGVATTIAGSASTAASTRSPPECRTTVPGKARPSSSAVRASPTHRRPQPAVAALGAGPGRLLARRTSAQAGGVGRPGEAQRARAGLAAGRRAAALAGQAGRVAAARGLHQHRALSPGRCGWCRRPRLGSRSDAGAWVAGQVAVAAAGSPRR